MKTFRLCAPAERNAAIAFTAAAIACFAGLLYVLRSNLGLLILLGLCTLLISALLVFYVVYALKSACIYDPATKQMLVKGFPDRTVDLSSAVLLQTLPRKNGRTVTRVLVFTDDKEEVIAIVPTLFNAKQGVMAEPFAKDMAAQMGLDFQQNVPEWEYDKKKYLEHEKEVAAQQKIEAKQRRQARIQHRINKYKKQM